MAAIAAAIAQSKPQGKKDSPELRKLRPDEVPLPMRPYLPDAAEIELAPFLVVTGGAESQKRLAVFPGGNSFPVLLVQAKSTKVDDISIQDSRGCIFSVRDKNGDGAIDQYSVSFVSGPARLTHVDLTMDGTFDLEVEEELDGVKATVQKARLQYRGSWYPYRVIDGKPHIEMKDGTKRVDIVNGQIELQ